MIWQITANHGGGYQYRLCPINEELTEECFQKHPLDFIKGSQYLQWNNGSRLHIKGMSVKMIFLESTKVYKFRVVNTNTQDLKLVGK